MESVGQKLRQARLRLGLTLDAVSSSTRITLRSLIAIEADQLDQISSPFLYKSFVRQFGQAVGLDPEMLQQDLLSAADSMPQPLVPGQNGARLPPSVAAPRRGRFSLSRWAYSLGSLCVMLAACSGLYAVWQKARTETPAQLVASAEALFPGGKSAPPAPTRPALKMPEIPAVTPSAQSLVSPPENESVFHIQLSAIEQTWLSVVTDGKEVYSGILHASETKSLEGHDAARIRTGNAGGVEVVFNGRNLGPLGSRGQVRTVLFNRNGYEVVQPDAVVLPPHLVLPAFDQGE